MFFAFGLGVGLWGGASGAILTRAGVDAAAFGVILTVYTAAYLIAMSATGALAHRFGLNRVLPVGAIIFGAALCALLNARSEIAVAIELVAAGFLGGVVDVSMNAEGARIERRLGRPILARLHAAASAGMAVGAILGSLIVASAAPWTAGVLAALGLAGAGVAYDRAARFDSPATAPVGVSPPKGLSFAPALIGLGVVIGVSIAAETAASLWAALLLREEAPKLAAIAGLGGAFFAGCQAALRFNADAIRVRVSDQRIIIASFAIAAAGFAVVGAQQGFAASVAGFALIGVGHWPDCSLRVRPCGAAVGGGTGGRTRLRFSLQRCDPFARAAGDRGDRPSAVASDRVRRFRGGARGDGRSGSRRDGVPPRAFATQGLRGGRRFVNGFRRRDSALPQSPGRRGHCFDASRCCRGSAQSARLGGAGDPGGEPMAKILPVIMCGGSGTRMWPESRESMPKQFIPLIGDRSTFQSIVLLIGDPEFFELPVVITNFEYRFRVAEQLRDVGAEATIVLEPERRDSAAAVGAAAAWAAARDPKTIVAVLAADHVFKDGKAFAKLCARAGVAAAAGEIVTFGVTPDRPATGYGYIHPGEPLAIDPQVRRITKFVEKPNEARAKAFIQDGYLWNSGNFVFRADAMLEELARFGPEIATATAAAVANAKEDLGFVVLDRELFAKAPKTSIDFAVMERTAKAAVLAADVGWSDVGEWSSVWRLSPHDSDGNSLRGRAVAIDTTNSLVRSDEGLTAVIGLRDAVVVVTGDAVLVADRSQTDKVKQLVERLKSERHSEATQHRRNYRPWGYYQSVDQGDRYQVKRIVVQPGGRLSLQKHYHRAEHWIVVRGAAEVTLDGKELLVHENESIYLPIGSDHRLANPGKIDLELIEVQTGSYLGEDDIVRIEDIYNRV